MVKSLSFTHRLIEDDRVVIELYSSTGDARTSNLASVNERLIEIQGNDGLAFPPIT